MTGRGGIVGAGVPPRPTTAVTWKPLVDEFRRREPQDWLMGVGAGPTIVRLLATWPAAEASVPRPRWLEHQWTAKPDWSDRWWWLWGQRFPDGPPWAVWADAAGVNLEYREDTMERLRFLRIVYPDGTIAQMAQRLIGDRMVEEFRTAQRRLAQRASGAR